MKMENYYLQNTSIQPILGTEMNSHHHQSDCHRHKRVEKNPSHTRPHKYRRILCSSAHTCFCKHSCRLHRDRPDILHFSCSINSLSTLIAAFKEKYTPVLNCIRCWQDYIHFCTHRVHWQELTQNRLYCIENTIHFHFHCQPAQHSLSQWCTNYWPKCLSSTHKCQLKGQNHPNKIGTHNYCTLNISGKVKNRERIDWCWS